jgi:hypothetical protein
MVTGVAINAVEKDSQPLACFDSAPMLAGTSIRPDLAPPLSARNGTMEENVLLDASMAGIIMSMSPPADRGCMSVKSASVPARKDKGLTAVVIVERTIKFSTAVA